ncbi:PmoA family protein [Streptomyces sp. NBC_01136]|uniref:DUF6807 family protein n=1 Tax=Streptomyces sp. NBC_01136 TaxID=2903754 RepID=UPI0038662B10|nr:PmoA family protein [Streptomyces sp. NBC_01136]
MNHAQSTDSLVLRVAGRPVGRYVTRPELAPRLSPRPYLHPVTTLAGTAVTELSPADHTHHLGVGVAVPDVEGHNFWGGRTYVRDQGPTELDNHGAQRHSGFQLRDPDGFDDDFPGGRFGRQWQWTANPQDGWATQHSGDGLRLSCVRTVDAHDLRKLPNVLTQRLPGIPVTAEVELRLDSEEPGARAGLAVLGDAFSWIGLQREVDGSVRFVHRFAESVAMGAPPTPLGQWGRERDAAHAQEAPEGRVRLWIEIGAGARCRFSYDVGGGRQPSGQVFAAPLALGGRPARALRARARRRGTRRRGLVHAVPHHRFLKPAHP